VKLSLESNAADERLHISSNKHLQGFFLFQESTGLQERFYRTKCNSTFRKDNKR
jgi:hypothetical protein